MADAPDTIEDVETTRLDKAMRRVWRPYRRKPERYQDPNRLLALLEASEEDAEKMNEEWLRFWSALDGTLRAQMEHSLKNYNRRLEHYRQVLDTVVKRWDGSEKIKDALFANVTQGLLLRRRKRSKKHPWKDTDAVPDAFFPITFRKMLKIGVREEAKAWSMFWDDLIANTDRLILKPVVELGTGVVKTVQSAGKLLPWLAAVGATVTGGIVVWLVSRRLERKKG